MNFTPQVKLILNILPSLWKNLASNQEKIIDATFHEYQQFLQIQFITDTFATQAKYMKANMSQSFQKNFLIKRTLFCEANHKDLILKLTHDHFVEYLNVVLVV
ncbi:MAG: hypothetical protein WC577_03690 [Candidatus Paceibacterota bacterium]